MFQSRVSTTFQDILQPRVIKQAFEHIATKQAKLSQAVLSRTSHSGPRPFSPADNLLESLRFKQSISAA